MNKKLYLYENIVLIVKNQALQTNKILSTLEPFISKYLLREISFSYQIFGCVTFGRVLEFNVPIFYRIATWCGLVLGIGSKKRFIAVLGCCKIMKTMSFFVLSFYISRKPSIRDFFLKSNCHVIFYLKIIEFICIKFFHVLIYTEWVLKN